MKKLVVVADDYGFTSGVNKAMIESYTEGMVTELSMMMFSPGTDEAVDLAKQHSIGSVGIHLTMNRLDRGEKYLRTQDYQRILDTSSKEALVGIVLEEVSAFERLVGHKPSHIIGHQNIHLHPKLFDFVVGYALKNDISVRKGREIGGGTGVDFGDIEHTNQKLISTGVKVANNLLVYIVGEVEQVKRNILGRLAEITDGEVAELVLHPANIDDALRKYTSMTDARERDLQIATDIDFRKQIEGMGFEIGGYSILD